VSNDRTTDLAEQVRVAHSSGSILNIVGGGSKSFLAGKKREKEEPVVLTEHHGIVQYEPGELVITARSGTLLKDINTILSDNKQMLAFEPPAFGDNATLGGTIACGLSGPRRPYCGSARDFVLGIRMINGRGEVLHFGGEVMKNVAGYDVSRLMTGSMGTLGILLEISLKVLPKPEYEATLIQKLSPEDARASMLELARQYLPVSGMSYTGEFLGIRLSGTKDTVDNTAKKIGGDRIDNSAAYWHGLKEQTHPFFSSGLPLWRLSVPPASHWHELKKEINGDYISDWGGAQLWLLSDERPEKIFSCATARGGHGRVFRQGERPGHIYPQSPTGPLMDWHRNIKRAFDPKQIFNPGRLFRDL